MLYSLLFDGIMDWIFKTILVGMGGGCQMGKSTYAMGGRSKRTFADDGGGVIFLPFWCVRANQITPLWITFCRVAQLRSNQGLSG